MKYDISIDEHKNDPTKGLYLDSNKEGFICWTDSQGQITLRDIDTYYLLEDLPDVVLHNPKHMDTLIFDGTVWTNKEICTDNEIVYHSTNSFLSTKTITFEDNGLIIDGSLCVRDTIISDNCIVTPNMTLDHDICIVNKVHCVTLNAYNGILCITPQTYTPHTLYTLTVNNDKIIKDKTLVFLYYRGTVGKLCTFVTNITEQSFDINFYTTFPPFNESIRLYFRLV